MFITYDLINGKIDAIRSASNHETESDILSLTYGSRSVHYGAIQYQGEDLTGKIVDVATKKLVDDPNFVRYETPVEAPVATETP